jgi:hypothetical protein
MFIFRFIYENSFVLLLLNPWSEFIHETRIRIRNKLETQVKLKVNEKLQPKKQKFNHLQQCTIEPWIVILQMVDSN